MRCFVTTYLYGVSVCFYHATYFNQYSATVTPLQRVIVEAGKLRTRLKTVRSKKKWLETYRSFNKVAKKAKERSNKKFKLFEIPQTALKPKSKTKAFLQNHLASLPNDLPKQLLYEIKMSYFCKTYFANSKTIRLRIPTGTRDIIIDDI